MITSILNYKYFRVSEFLISYSFNITIPYLLLNKYKYKETHFMS